MKKEFYIPLYRIDSGKSFKPIYEFHISGECRKKYEFDEVLFSFNGNVIFANYQAARVFTYKMNQKRPSDKAVSVGQVNAMGLLDEIYHFILRQYETKVNPAVFTRAVNHSRNFVGEEDLKVILQKFVEQFPPASVYKNGVHPLDYLNNTTDGRSNMDITLEELILLHIANFNPANLSFKELFDDSELQKNTSYNNLLIVLDKFFEKEPPFGPDNQPILEMLRAPILNNPGSLEAQLKFIMDRWKIILDEKFLRRILGGMDLIKEDYRLGWGGGGGAPTVVPKYKGEIDDSDILSLGKSGYKYGSDSHLQYAEPERFTPDIHWMPQVVLLAKNIYVWLDQLSKKYHRSITKLNEIPDEELDLISSWNFTGLWLIGLWERSRSSQKIKQMMGNPEAVSSAYSLYDYVIAHDLGGEDAFQNLNARAMKRGIRLASDMVPNHMGIYSKWVVERPDYFIQAAHSPFPNYSFTGPDLSDDPKIQLRIEDGYWRKSDAAVVFQRIDNYNGEIRYIYHGNDGTNMPWNDTAQLDMLKAEVREAVIQTMFHVARKTSIIRFDAAMTLAKRHFHRLWYPQPGTGGDIPSRADYGLTREEFDIFFPQEFWREVVDRFNAEMPDTLLLAEAFWLMEGYFVRTLGMHRVYNSAFMHMMMKEENAKYRDVISNTLEFNPEILKRYVSFMSNPDEETAIKQFGTDDKYFGVATLLVTLPGLPMFGHGQIEGYTEKYGMEYKRAYYNESSNQWLIDRHKREIFPLMKKRYMFAEVINFWFYDFIDGNGNINENVFAYSNYYHNDKAIVIYNNKYDETRGWINYSTPKVVAAGNGKKTETRTLAYALGLNPGDNFFYTFREQKSNYEYIRTGKELSENGLYVELQAFKSAVFLDFREAYDDTGEMENLRNYLNGKGVPDIYKLIFERRLASIHDAYLNIFDSASLKSIDDYYSGKLKDGEERIKFIVNRFLYFLTEVQKKYDGTGDINKISGEFKEEILAIVRMNQFIENNTFQINENVSLTNEFRKSILISREANYKQNMLLYLIWVSIYQTGKLLVPANPDASALELFDRLMLEKPIRQILHRLGRSADDIEQDFILIKILLKYYSLNKKINEGHYKLTAHERLFMADSSPVRNLTDEEIKLIEVLVGDGEVKKIINTNYYEGTWYYSKENLEELLNWLMTLNIVQYFYDIKTDEINDEEAAEFIKDSFHLNKTIKDISAKSEYKLDIFWNQVTGKNSTFIKDEEDDTLLIINKTNS